MKAKYIIGAILILAVGFEIYRIEKQLAVVTLEVRKTDRATITIPSLAPAAALNDSDQFVVADGGTVTRRLAGAKITGAIGDTANTLRGEMGTAGAGIPGTVGVNQIAIGKSGDSLQSDAYFKIVGDSLIAKMASVQRIFWKKHTGLTGNYSLFWNGSTKEIDSASFTPAAQAWKDFKAMNVFQRLWLLRFWDARKHEAYPLPNRAGVELRRWDPSEGMYQFEYEMEMMGLGLYQLYKVTAFILLFLIGGFVYLSIRKR